MRTTLALDDDVMAFARDFAQKNRLSIGEAVSELARAGIRSSGVTHPRAIPPRSRFALLGRRDETITTEHVRALIDQEGI